jgi:hypothetical protein
MGLSAGDTALLMPLLAWHSLGGITEPAKHCRCAEAAAAAEEEEN